MTADKSKTKSAYLEGERLSHFKSLSGIQYKEVYTPEDVTGACEMPGVYPFTADIYPCAVPGSTHLPGSGHLMTGCTSLIFRCSR